MRAISLTCLYFFALIVNAQNNNKITRAEYILTYKEIAMEEMKRSGIPASITLAQGILESGDGNSRLATKANNHFGIKCHNWDGPSITHDDDEKNECFRKYKSAEASYRDHSDFLSGRNRYAELFELKPDDYKAWAKGLKNSGYATSPDYAKALTGIIEDNELYKFDAQVLSTVKNGEQALTDTKHNLIGNGRKVFFNNRVKYIIADSSDTYGKLTEELHLMGWQLPRYNEVSLNTTINRGDYIYLQPKRNRAASGLKVHFMQEGESLHSISQTYGIKVQKLRERNNIPENSEPLSGVGILLRGKVRSDLPMKELKEVIPPKEETVPNEEEPEFEVEFDLGS